MGGTVVSKRNRRPVNVYGHDSSMGYRYRNGSVWTTSDVEVFGIGHQWAAVPTQQTTSFRTRGEDPDGLRFGSNSTQLSFGELREYSNLAEAYRHGDTGHPFDTIDHRIEVSHPHVRFQSLDRTAEYEGPVVPDPAYSLVVSGGRQFVDIAASTDLVSVGTNAIARTIPTNPLVDLTQTIGEFLNAARGPGGAEQALKDLIDIRPKSRGKGGVVFAKANDASSLYLNNAFGSGAVVRDLRSASQAVMDTCHALERLRRKSGVDIRRRLLIQIEDQHLGSRSYDGRIYDVTNNSTVRPKLWPSKPDGSSGLQCRFQESITKHVYTYFRGAFTYHLPDDHPVWGRLDGFLVNARKTYGLRIDEEAIWDLLPWSWLLGWFTDIGDLIHNISAFQNDSLVLRYGYVMRQTWARRKIDCTGYTALPGCPPAIYTDYLTVRKERVKATPYGFGLNPQTFSERQWGILSALGISKAWHALT